MDSYEAVPSREVHVAFGDRRSGVRDAVATLLVLAGDGPVFPLTAVYQWRSDPARAELGALDAMATAPSLAGRDAALGLVVSKLDAPARQLAGVRVGDVDVSATFAVFRLPAIDKRGHIFGRIEIV